MPNEPQATDDRTRLRYIPFRRSDIERMCLKRLRLEGSAPARFARLRAQIDTHYRDEFTALRRQLKELYAPLDPDADTQLVQFAATDERRGDFPGALEALLVRANYKRVSREELQAAFDSASLFNIRLQTDLEAYDQLVLYFRGATPAVAHQSKLFGLWQRDVPYTRFERVVLFLRVREDLAVEEAAPECRPGSTLLKLFQNVPGADIEMLFPNTRVGMRLRDKLAIGIPAIISGGAVFNSKLAGTVLLLGSLFGYWMGLNSERVTLDRGALLVLLAGFGALLGYLWRQYSKFRNRKLRFQKALTQHLYFKLLDTNAGVLFRLLDDAEESECKECLLAAAFLLAGGAPASAEELDRAIEAWFAEHWGCALDFDVTDALRKLAALGLVRRAGDRWQLSDAPAGEPPDATLRPLEIAPAPPQPASDTAKR
jgi:Protein of unknown function (DUF3754)